MRILAALTVASTMLFGTVAAHAATGREAKGLIIAGVLKSSKVADKATPFKTKLGGKPGDVIRPWTASNVRTFIGPGRAPNGALGGARYTIGGTVLGTINMKTNRVKVTGIQMLRTAR